MDSENVRVHLFIEGYVQGVSYRWWCYREAEKYKITGWVRNLSDGRVEAVFEGRKNAVDSLVEKCKEGPPFAEVKHMDVSREKYSGEFQIFEVRPRQ